MFLSSGKKKESSKLNLCLDFIGLRTTFLKFSGKDFMLPFQSIDYENGVKKKRGTHFCVPVFGKPPIASELHGKIPQHGFLRDMRVNLKRVNGSESMAEATFNTSRADGYPWAIRGQMSFYCTNNTLKIETTLSRSWGCVVGKLAPVNIGFHPYWLNKNGVSVSTNGFTEKLNEIIVPSCHIPYLEPVVVKLHGIGSVTMEMTGDCLKYPEIVMWTDHKNFCCVELVAADSKKFDTEEGILLERGESVNLTLSLKFSNKK